MELDLSFIFIIILICFAEYTGDSNFKKYAHSNDKNSLFMGFFGYLVLIYLLIQIFKRSNLIYVNGLWNGFYTIVTSILAYYLLGERLNNKYQWLGLLLVVFGTSLLSIGEIPV